MKNSENISADAVYKNGVVYTVNPKQPWADAFAVKNGKFITVGSQADVSSFIGEKTETIDLEGKFVMPGMGDMHQHWDMGPLQEKQGWLTVEGMPPYPDELKTIILEYAEKNPDMEWIIGRNGCWFDEMFVEAGVKPGCAWLDSFIPDRPVALQDIQGHIIMANSLAMELAGITFETADPTNGVIMRDERGQPTGILSDGAQTLIMRTWPLPSHRLHVETFYEQSRRMNSFGLTMIKLVHSRIPSLEALRELDFKYNLHLWMDVFTSWKDDIYPVPGLWEFMAGKRFYYVTRHVNPLGIKWHHDGTVAAGSGYSLEPYADCSDIDCGEDLCGRTNMTFEETVETIAHLDSLNLPVVAHAVADGSVRMLLDAVEIVRERNGNSDTPHTISHCYVVQPEDMPRFASLNVFAEVATGFAWFNFGSESFIRRLGDRIIPHFFPVKGLVDAGATVIPGSDYTVGTSPRPLEAMENYITRKRPSSNLSIIDSTSDTPMGKGITLEQAIQILTMNCAQVLGRSDKTGSIEVGKSADFVILGQNLFEISPEKISETEVFKTVFEGEAVFDASKENPYNEKLHLDIGKLEKGCFC